MVASTTAPRLTFHDYLRPGQRGEWLADEEVRIVGPDGEVVARRENPRQAFRGLRTELAWDDLDFLCFGAYALRNYLNTPFLLGEPGVEVAVLPAAAGGTHLQATFPASVPTHGRRQHFWFDADHRLTRLDYTADVVGFWARVAHTVGDGREASGLWFPTRRLVRPTFGLPWALPFPDIVRIELHEVGVVGGVRPRGRGSAAPARRASGVGGERNRAWRGRCSASLHLETAPCGAARAEF